MCEKLKSGKLSVNPQPWQVCMSRLLLIRTAVVQMLCPESLMISVATSCDMEVTLHLIQQQAAKNATAIPIPWMALNLRRLGPLARPLRSIDNVMHMLLPKSLIVKIRQIPFPAYHTPIHITPQLMLSLGI